MTGIPVAPGELVDAVMLNELARARYRKTTAKQVVNSVVETDLLNGEITIAAGAMSTSRALRLTAWGDLINNTGAAVGAPRFKLKLGATTLLDTNTLAAAWGAGANREPWRFVAEIANLGATNSQWVSLVGDIYLGNTTVAALFTTGEGVYATAGNTAAHALGAVASAVDTTAAQALALTVTLATANALEDVTLKGAIVEIV